MSEDKLYRVLQDSWTREDVPTLLELGYIEEDYESNGNPSYYKIVKPFRTECGHNYTIGQGFVDYE